MKEEKIGESIDLLRFQRESEKVKKERKNKWERGVHLCSIYKASIYPGPFQGIKKTIMFGLKKAIL